MKKFLLSMLIIIYAISLFGCVNQSQDNIDVVPSNNDASQNDANGYNNTPPKNNIYPILASINADTINLAKYLFDLDLDLEGMEKEYGPIMKVDWIDGALYRHEKMDLWISYFTAEIEGDFVVSEVTSYIDYAKEGPFTTLEQAKKSPIFYLKCELSDVFDEPESMAIEDFTPFAKIYESLEWTGKDIVFDYEKLTIKIMCYDDDTLHADCVVFISCFDVSAEPPSEGD